MRPQQPVAHAVPGRHLCHPLVCELVGLPGAGKTTMAAAIADAFRRQGWRCADRRGPRLGPRARGGAALRKLKFHLSSPGHLAAAVWFCSSVRPSGIGVFSRAVRLAQHRYGIEQARSAHVDLVVLDQGVVQELWSVALGARGWGERQAEHVVREGVGKAGVTPLFVYVDVPVEQAVERIRGRASSSSRFDRLPAAESRRRLTEASSTLERLFQLAVTATGAGSCRIDGTAPIEQAAGAAIAFIGANLGTARDPIGRRDGMS